MTRLGCPALKKAQSCLWTLTRSFRVLCPNMPPSKRAFETNDYPLSQSSRAVYSMFANAAACYYNSSLSLYGTTSSSTSVVLYSVCVFIYFGSGTFHAFFNASARFSTPSMPASSRAILLNSARMLLVCPNVATMFVWIVSGEKHRLISIKC